MSGGIRVSTRDRARARATRQLLLDGRTLNALARLVQRGAEREARDRQLSRAEMDAIDAVQRHVEVRAERPMREGLVLSTLAPASSEGLRIYPTSGGALCVQRLTRRGRTLVPHIDEEWTVPRELIPGLRRMLQFIPHQGRASAVSVGRGERMREVR